MIVESVAGHADVLSVEVVLDLTQDLVIDIAVIPHPDDRVVFVGDHSQAQVGVLLLPAGCPVVTRVALAGTEYAQGGRTPPEVAP